MDEIEEIFQTGITSAQAGNRRLAQACFKRVIRMEPRHEEAWLWLSQVLDDLDDIAYCLEAALAISPQNEKARLVLERVREGRTEPQRPAEWSALGDLLDLDLPRMLTPLPAPAAPESSAEVRRDWLAPWWQTGLFFLAVLVVLSLSFYLSVRPAGDAPATPGIAPTRNVALSQQHEREVVRAYFAELDAWRSPLRLAHDVYRGQSNQRVSLADQVAYTRALRDQVVVAREALQGLKPPPALAEAHWEYSEGLRLEQEGLDSLLDYFRTSQTSAARQATVDLQEAGTHLERAKAIWADYRQAAGLPEPTRLPTPTPRATPTYGPTPTMAPTFTPRPTNTPTPFPTQPIG